MPNPNENPSIARCIRLFLDPAERSGQPLPERWYVALLFPMLTFLFFFLQQSIDRSFLGFFDPVSTAMQCFVGFCSGILLPALTAGILRLCSGLTGIRAGYRELLTELGLSFFLPMLINFSGVLIDAVFGLKTAVLFGLTGILFSLIPLYAAMLRLGTAEQKRARGIALLTVTASGLADLVFLSVLPKILG